MPRLKAFPLDGARLTFRPRTGKRHSTTSRSTSAGRVLNPPPVRPRRRLRTGQTGFLGPKGEVLPQGLILGVRGGCRTYPRRPLSVRTDALEGGLDKAWAVIRRQRPPGQISIPWVSIDFHMIEPAAVYAALGAISIRCPHTRLVELGPGGSATYLQCEECGVVLVRHANRLWSIRPAFG